MKLPILQVTTLNQEIKAMTGPTDILMIICKRIVEQEMFIASLENYEILIDVKIIKKEEVI